jgi:Tol biopolymer transport system component
MPLEKGTLLGSYEILGMLGAGGMGEVYRARDTRLDREVAIKVLPEELAADAAALARFEREAKAVAALAHPNILAIYDFGAEGGRHYAVMELLEGQTLRDRLDEGAVPPRKAADLARQLADGLGAAHDRDIVHRDLKPENIFISADGRAKILDFGLAGHRTTGAATGSTAGPTRTSLTAPGTVMGTVGYMSPEQVRGDEADQRSDIFSLGCVLHEMLGGKRAFERDTAVETMTAILREEPEEPGATSGVAISPALGRVVRRCLEKSPAERFQSAQDLAFAIDNAATGSSPEVPNVAVDAPRAGRKAVLLTAALVGALGLVAGLAIGPRLVSTVTAEPVRVRTLTVAGRDKQPSASPDGEIVAFQSSRDGTPRIWIKQLSGGGEQPLTQGPDSLPRFSPDGSTLLFLRDDGGVMSVYRQSLIGGQARKLVEDASDACWSPDGDRIAFLRLKSTEGRRFGMVGVADAQAGRAEVIHEGNTAMFGLAWSPDGRYLASIEASVTGNNPDYRLVLIDAETGETERMSPGGGGLPLSSPEWTDGGELILAIAGSLLGDQGDSLSRFVRFDPRTRETTTLFWAQHLFPMQGIRADFTTVDVVTPGRLVFHQVTVRQRLRRVSLSDEAPHDGRVLTQTEGRDRQPVFAPDGRRVVFSSNRSGNLDLWSIDLGTEQMRQLTDDAAQDWDPGFAPDGKQLVWSSNRGGHLEIWIADADGSGARQLTQDGVDAENPTVTRDGSWVVYWSANPEKIGVWKIRTDGSEATRLATGAYVQPEVSPDGRYAAFISLELDNLRNLIHVVDVERAEMVPFEIEVRTPLRAGGNMIFGRVRWLPDGSGLAYVGIDDENRSGIFAQDFAPGQDTSSTRRKLAGFSPDYKTESFGISPDGREIVISTMEQTDLLALAEGVAWVAP